MSQLHVAVLIFLVALASARLPQGVLVSGVINNHELFTLVSDWRETPMRQDFPVPPRRRPGCVFGCYHVETLSQEANTNNVYMILTNRPEKESEGQEIWLYHFKVTPQGSRLGLTLVSMVKAIPEIALAHKLANQFVEGLTIRNGQVYVHVFQSQIYKMSENGSGTLMFRYSAWQPQVTGHNLHPSGEWYNIDLNKALYHVKMNGSADYQESQGRFSWCVHWNQFWMYDATRNVYLYQCSETARSTLTEAHLKSSVKETEWVDVAGKFSVNQDAMGYVFVDDGYIYFHKRAEAKFTGHHIESGRQVVEFPTFNVMYSGIRCVFVPSKTVRQTISQEKVYVK